MSTFSRNLVFLREQSNLTQAQTAQRLSQEKEKIDLKRYQAWEEERGCPPFHLLVKICDMFEYRDIYTLLTADLRKLVEKKAV